MAKKTSPVSRGVGAGRVLIEYFAERGENRLAARIRERLIALNAIEFPETDVRAALDELVDATTSED